MCLFVAAVSGIDNTWLLLLQHAVLVKLLDAQAALRSCDGDILHSKPLVWPLAFVTQS